MWETLSQFRDPNLGRPLLERVRSLAERVADRLGRVPVFMEVCGTHTVAISRAGLRAALRGLVELRSGPGCPVCVTDPAELDAMIGLAREPGVTVTTFGDMLRVPGSRGSLDDERTAGADVRVVYSPADAVELAAALPDRQVVFLGVGFETTAPAVALAGLMAAERGLGNFTIFAAHKVYPPALEALLADPGVRLDGFLLPGHATTVLGRRRLDFLAERHRVPAVISGFEPVDILAALHELLEQVVAGEARVVNAYPRLVREEGNPRAVAVIERLFASVYAAWRGIGVIPQSGLDFRPEWRHLSAQDRFRLEVAPGRPHPGCRCGDLMKGKAEPFDCRLFARAWRPERPFGPCMVSSEGACAAYYRYERANALEV